jgi:hypothetical protein
LREAQGHLPCCAAREVTLVVERLRRDVHVLGVRRPSAELQRGGQQAARKTVLLYG